MAEVANSGMNTQVMSWPAEAWALPLNAPVAAAAGWVIVTRLGAAAKAAWAAARLASK